MNSYVPDVKTPVILMTDIGSDVDDALALLAILNSNINLKAIITVNGKVNFRSYIAKQMVNLSGKSIDVVVGDSEPISTGVLPYSFFEEAYVPESMNSCIPGEREVSYAKFDDVGIIENAIPYLKNLLATEQHVIFSIGPMTTLAHLVEQAPECIKNIAQVYVMGCRFAETPTNEHNVRYDIQAAQAVFQSQLPITVVPGNLCTQYRWSPVNKNLLTTNVGEYVGQMLDGFIAVKTAHEFVRGDCGLKGRESNTDFIRSLLLRSLHEVAPEQQFDRDQYYRKLIVNLDDIEGAAYWGASYLEQIKNLIEALQGHLPKDTTMFHVGNWLKSLAPQNISVADVYVPFCFLYHQALFTQVGTVSIDYMGFSTFSIGEGKHRVVENIQFQEFEMFLNQSLV